jgi:hypothetical protein
MRVSRWLLRLALTSLVFGLAILTPKTSPAEVNCYNIQDCTYCDFWDGTVYHGYMRKCAV